MTWHKGFARLRFIGLASLGIGMVMLAAVWAARATGVEADPVTSFMCAIVWASGITLLVLGNVLWIALWVLKGFVPDGGPELAASVAS